MRARILLRLALGTLVAGVLLAALVLPLLLFPGVVTSGLAARADVHPAADVDRALPGPTRVVADDGSLIAQFYSHDPEFGYRLVADELAEQGCAGLAQPGQPAVQRLVPRRHEGAPCQSRCG